MLPRRTILLVLVTAAALLPKLPWLAAAGPDAPPPPPSEVTLFEPGTLSTGAFEYNASFTPDGRTLYFSIAAPRLAAKFFAAIVASHWRDGRWTTPEVAEFSGRFGDFDPFVSPDGSRLFFSSVRPVDPAGDTPRPDFDLWATDRTAQGGWGPPRHLAEVNTEAQDLYPSVAADGTLYFGSGTRPDTQGGFDIYHARPSGSGYLAPQGLDEVNTAAWEFNPWVAPDGSFLLFTSAGRPDSLGSSDLYISYFRDGRWTPGRNLGPKVNTPGGEFHPSLSRDLKTLYFVSARGFSDRPRQAPFNYRDLLGALRGVENGGGNLYHVSVEALGLEP